MQPGVHGVKVVCMVSKWCARCQIHLARYFISNSGRIVFEKSRLNGRHALRTKMDKPISLNINRLRFASFSNGDQTVDQVSCTLTKCQP